MAEIVDVAGDPVPPDALARAVAALDRGQVVGVPTDTVYGLAADPRRLGATERIFAAKGRPRSVELPVLVAGQAQALELCAGPPGFALALMERFWPGGLTLVVARREGLGLQLGGDDASIGLRCPDHVIAQTLCRSQGPLATTSANLHGSAPATTAAEVASLEGVAVVLDAGPCPLRPSTVVACTSDRPVLLRAGAVEWEDIVAVAGS